MSEHRIPRDQKPFDQEVFQAKEVATGKIIPFRDLTDEQLVRNIADANRQSKEFMLQGMQLIGVSQTAGKAASCMEYELDRRRRSISLITDLNQIQGLSKQ